MSKYKIDKQDGAYFMTFTTVGWDDLLIRDTYKQFIADCLNYFTDNRGLEIYSYVIMPSHIHLIAGSKKNNLSTLVGSFKKYTSRELIKMIKNPGESRRECLPSCGSRQGCYPFSKRPVKTIQETGTTRFGSRIIILKKFIRQNLRLAR